VKVIVVGDGRLAARAALEAEEGVDLVDPPEGRPASTAGEVEEIASELRAFQGRLEGGAVDRVVLVGSSNPALAAILVASKMRIPTAAVESEADDGAEGESFAINGRLIEQLADAALADDAAAIAAWLAEPQQPTQPLDEH
jgi:hypothetical protein